MKTRSFIIHPQSPQKRLIEQVVTLLKQGGIVALPTDAAYVLACAIDQKTALAKVKKLRGLNDSHLFTLMASSMADIGYFTRINNEHFRLVKSLIPGPFTFILDATPHAPKKILHQKRKTLGIRIPQSAICQAILTTLAEPLLVTTLKYGEQQMSLIDAKEIQEKLDGQIDGIIDDECNHLSQTTTVIDLTADEAIVVRQGIGLLPE